MALFINLILNLMTKNNKEHLEETEKLHNEIEALHQQLIEARESVEAIKTIKIETIDALVVRHEKDLKVYTEKTADKPYRILIEKMHEGAVTLNKDGTILYCNSYFANLVKLPLQNVIGTKFENFIDKSSKENIEAILTEDGVTALKEEVFIKTSDRRKIRMLMTLNTLTLDNILVLSIILTDLTVQYENQEILKRRTKQLEEKNQELVEAFKELIFQTAEKEKRGKELIIAKTEVKELVGLNTHKESVLATLSHDLRSPLAGIIGIADALKENYETLDHGEVIKLIDLLYKASIDELGMLDYLVEWARIKYALEAFSPKEIELVQYVKKVFYTLNENAAAKNIHLYNEVEEDIHVFADEKMLLSILQNIISNSIKYTLAEGKITLIAKRNEDKITVEIKDTGIGMSKEIIEKLFTPQIRSLSSTRKENKGAGIGLLLVKGFLETNGGEIWVESLEGEGSSFYFTLPAKKPLDK